MADLITDVTTTIRDIPDFPKAGILFKDITPVLSNPALFSRVIEWMAAQTEGQQIDQIVGMESRGFIFGAPLVSHLNAGFVPARKPGKLPYQKVGVDYALEYGTARLEIHVDAIKPGEKVLVVDDLLATGGTAAATIDLIKQVGGVVVAALFLVELDFLNGRDQLDVPVKSLVHY